MSILAKNLKTIRRGLGCIQSAMADILKIGFRTYVRYEAGERDAPVSVLVTMAKLANMSLEQMLTTEIAKDDVVGLVIDRKATVPEVKKCDFRRGQIEFRKPAGRALLVLGDKERKLFWLFRRMDSATQMECLESMRKVSKGSKGSPEKNVRKGKPKKMAIWSEPVVAKVAGKKGKPGRRRVDKKALNEKISRLKMITKSINRVTVR